MKYYFAIVTVFLCFQLAAQEIPPKHPQIDSFTYKKYVTLLKKSKKGLTDNYRPMESANFPMHHSNIIVSLYHLVASSDTLDKYVSIFFNKYPVKFCRYAFQRKYPLSSIVKMPHGYWKKYKCKCDTVWSKLDSNLIALLYVMGDFDQKVRGKKENAPWKAGNEKKWEEQTAYDKYNEALLDMIFQRYGYPHYNLVGLVDNIDEVAFYVLQHSSLAFQEKYLPLIKKTCMERLLPMYFYAMLKDRILMFNHKPQIFGTQFVFDKKRDSLVLYKVADYSKLAKLRKMVNLAPIEISLKNNNALLK